MFNAVRSLLNGMARFCMLIELEVTRIEGITDDKQSIVGLLRLRAIARQLFYDLTGRTWSAKRWGTIPCETELMKGHNPFWKAVRMIAQVEKGLDPNWTKGADGREIVLHRNNEQGEEGD